ncbi:MAG: FAD-binding protein [Thermoplasmata archaeon]|nr:FAD-binding protein [Thermoplasmata archaeon]
MEIAVLLKVVPATDAMRFDPVLRAAIREGVPLFPNPFDQRALRVALEMRRPGESVTVLSMGPPSTEPALRESLELGADRVVLITDPRLAGSDTLASARALVRGLGRTGHSLVLTGRSSTDSDTGQLPAEVAGLLGVPIVSSALRILRDVDGDGLEVVGETDQGSARFCVEPPVVVSVGEKIAKPLRPTPEQVDAGRMRAVERWSLSDIGLDPRSVGFEGSPTSVLSLASPAPTRRGVVFDTGSVDERVASALRELPEAAWGSAASAPIRALAADGRPLDQHEMCVLVTGADGHLEPSALPLASGLSASVSPGWSSAIWVGAPPTTGELAMLEGAGLLRGYQILLDPARLDSRSVALAVQRVLEEREAAAAGAFLSSTFGREVAGQVAARVGLGLIGDAVGVERNPAGELLWSKPAFGGGAVATIRSRTRPSLATIRDGVFPNAAGGGPPGALSWEELPFDPPGSSLQLLERTSEADPEFGDLSRSSTVVCVGRGIGGPEEIGALRPWLTQIGAALAATRKVVDAGWVRRHRQAGLTGRTLAPALVILLGVHGAPNQMVAWRRAGAILAVDPDRNAPVFRQADVGVVGTWQEVLPVLRAKLTLLRARVPG